MAPVDSDPSPSPLLPWALPLLRLSLWLWDPGTGCGEVGCICVRAGWVLNMGPGDTQWMLMQALPCLERCPYPSSPPEGPQKTFETDTCKADPSSNQNSGG